MRKLIIFSLVFATFLILVSCGHREGVSQPDNPSYIWFSGNTDGTVAIIDGNESFKVDLTYINSEGEKVKRDGKTLYEVKPGKHEILVKRNGEVVIHRVLIINPGATKELRVP
ncbi:hypothetical protein KKG22_06375 [Patescibacteria group bacterium]|nr:hypothetical protein [Patescibacteria group bacterium]MBU1931994.1 hypothetical protein [Patescibacteria group bacterium]